MSNRVASMIAIMRHSLMRKESECSVPGNRFCFNILGLLREQGLISGFYIDLEEKKKKKDSLAWVSANKNTI